MSIKWASRIAFCICLAASRYAFSDGVMVDEVSPRALSRGGTNLGFADNGGILLDNPAAMVNIDGSKMVDIGVDTLLVSGWYSDPQTRIDTGSTFTPLPQISLIRNNGDFAYGFGIFTPAGFAERFHLIDPLANERVYESFGALVKFLPGVAYRVNDRLSIGGTCGVGVSYAELEGPYFLQGPSLPGPFTIMHTHNEGACLVWSVAAQYKLTDCDTIGVTYQSPSDLSMGGQTTVNVLAPPLGRSTFDSTLHVTWPQTVSLGIKHEFCEHRRMGVDVIWYDWEHSFDQFGLELRDPSNPAFPPQIKEELPLNWHDSVSTHIGYEQDFDRITFRVGYMYNPNPIPNNTLTPFIQGFMTHCATVGMGTCICGWDVDLGYVHEWGLTQHVGQSALVGNDFGNSDQRAAVDAIVLDFIKTF